MVYSTRFLYPSLDFGENSSGIFSLKSSFYLYLNRKTVFTPPSDTDKCPHSKFCDFILLGVLTAIQKESSKLHNIGNSDFACETK